MPTLSRLLYLAPGVLDRLIGGTLFYPGTGADWRVPIALFAPVISDFWFVDRGYLSPGHQDTRHDGMDRGPADAPPLLAEHPAYRLLHRALEEPLLQPGAALDLRRRPEPNRVHRPDADLPPRRRRGGPLILTEHYLHSPSGRNLRIHRCRGDVIDYFEGETRLSRLSVFFYRGDSAGEGGSGIRWLGERLQRAVLDRLQPGGLFVSDGSDGAMFPQRAPNPFRSVGICDVNVDVASAVARVPEIVAANGRQLRCVGYAGTRYGSTLVWQMPGAGYIEEPGWGPQRPHRPALDLPAQWFGHESEPEAVEARPTPKLDATRQAILLAPFDEEE